MISSWRLLALSSAALRSPLMAARGNLLIDDPAWVAGSIKLNALQRRCGEQSFEAGG